MHRMLLGAVALTLLGASAATAQPYGQGDHHDGGYHDQNGERHDDGDRHDNCDRHDGDRRDGDRHDGDRWDNNGHHGDNWRARHRTHTVCAWRHHRRVCWQQRNW